jgi:shikimate dehydrogenase
MRKYLVIGNPIGHSLSPLIHNHWMRKHGLVDSIYEKKKVEKEDLESIVKQVRNDQLKGINITVPFKNEIIPFLDRLDNVALSTQSVNTLFKVKNEVWGYNTDVEGFDDSLTGDNIEYNNKNIFILGAGGVTSSIIYNLIFTANKIYISNRTKKKAEQLKRFTDLTGKEIEIIDWGQTPKACDLVINTTSVGLTKDENLGIDFKDYKNNKDVLFYDIIYNPEETNFLKDARLRDNKIMNGKMMFLHQARIAFQIWTGITAEIDDEVIKLLD